MTVGARASRVDGEAKVTGAAEYPGDRHGPDSLWAKVVFRNQPHARLRLLDTSVAEQLPGLIAVFVASDVPVNEYGLTLFDQPVLIGPKQDGRSKAPSNISRWEADHLAIIVAETPEAADAAAGELVAEWEPLPVVGDVDAALDADAPLIHPENDEESSSYYSYKIRKGDMDAGWNQAAVVVDGTYEVPYQEHAYLQPEAGLAYVDEDGRVTVEVAGQWAHEDRCRAPWRPF